MAQVLNIPTATPFPTIEPRPTPPEDLQRIPTNPREFGVQIGEGLERLGAGATKAGQFFGEVAADDAVNKWQTETNKLLYGDPNNPNDKGYYGLRGEDAMRARPIIGQKISQLRDQYRAALMTPAQQLEYEQYTRRFQYFLNGEINRHYEQQFTAYQAATNKASADLALHGIASHANDQDALNNFTGDLMRAYIRDAQAKYGANASAEIIGDAMARARSDATMQQIRSLARTDPAAALSAFNAGKGTLLGPAQDALSRELESVSTQVQGEQLLQQSRGGVAPTAKMPTARALPLIERHESPGGNEPNYRFDPTHTASGYYQITDTNWRKYAPTVDIDLNKFPSAMSAPKDVQAQVAGKIYETEGWAPWAKFNARLAAAIPGGHHAPGVSDIAEAQSNLAMNFANQVAHIENAGGDPKATAWAVQKAKEDYLAHETALTGNMKAATERRNLAADSYVQRMMKGPLDAGIVNEIANDHALDATTRENLWRIYDAHTKSRVEGETAKYGPKFFEYYQRVMAADNDPSRLADPSQIYSLAVPHEDGSQDLTIAGVDKLTAAIRSRQHDPESAGASKLQQGALAYAKHQLSFEADYGVFKLRDPKGEDAFNVGFLPAFMKYWGDGLASGKSPSELVDKAQLDKLVAPYKRAPADEMKDKLEAGSEIPSTPAAKAGPPDGAVAFLRANPSLRAAFDEKYGAGAAEKALGPVGPTVPIR